MLKISSVSGLLLAGLLLLSAQAGLADGGRTELTGPGEAEVVASIGFEHTLFDSVDQQVPAPSQRPIRYLEELDARRPMRRSTRSTATAS